MFALRERDQISGRGQWIDLSIYEPMVAALGYQATAYDQLGTIQQRHGNRSNNNAPRNTYRTRDRSWIAVSCSTPSIVDRVLRLVGGDELVQGPPRCQTAAQRVKHVEVLDELVGGWIADRDLQHVMAAFEQAQAAIAPVYDIEQLLDDPHVQVRGTFATLEDEDLGPTVIQDVVPRLSRTPGRIRHLGPRLGHANEDVLSKDHESHQS